MLGKGRGRDVTSILGGTGVVHGRNILMVDSRCCEGGGGWVDVVEKGDWWKAEDGVRFFFISGRVRIVHVKSIDTTYPPSDS